MAVWVVLVDPCHHEKAYLDFSYGQLHSSLDSPIAPSLGRPNIDFANSNTAACFGLRSVLDR